MPCMMHAHAHAMYDACTVGTTARYMHKHDFSPVVGGLDSSGPLLLKV